MELVTFEDIDHATASIYERPDLVRKTPLLGNMQGLLGLERLANLHLKLENLQITGSFKIRGATRQFLCLTSEASRPVVTMSAGNYGKAFACVSKGLGKDSTVFMPVTSPHCRKSIIEAYGAKVNLCAKEDLQLHVDAHVRDHNSIFLHPFEDRNLIAAHGSAGLELVNDLAGAPDIVLVCCGGGGLLSGVSAALRLSGWKSTKIYGIESVNSPTMKESLEAGRPTKCQSSYTVAAGLSPPYVGDLTLKHVQEFADGILLVDDEDFIRATKLLFHCGLVVEPSGAACVAALLAGKVPDSDNKTVVAFVTGGNISAEELLKFGC